MKFIATLTVLLCVSGQILAREDRLSDDCLNGIADRDKCCAGVPDAWYAHLRNPEDCGSFYQCEHEKATWKACPAGLHWSVAADRCEWPHLAGCEAAATQEPSTQEPSTQEPEKPTTHRPTTEQPSTTAAPPSTSAPPTKDECAPEPVCHQCLSGVFPADLCCRDVETYHKLHLANANDCSSYYTCFDGHAVAHQCPEELHWSMDSDRCEWPVDAKCEANNGGNGNEGGNNGGEGGNNGGENGNGGVSNDCLHGKVDAKTCCQNVPSWVDVLLQNNADCHTFIQCVHGAPMVRPCPAGLWWSVTANRCEWKENATCTW